MPAPPTLTTYLMYVQLYTSSVAGGITPICTYLMYNSPRRLLPASLLYVCNVQLHTSSVAAGVITPMWIYIVMVCFYFSAVSSTSQQTDSPEIPIQIQDRIHLMCPTQNRKWLKASLGNIKITGRQCAGGQMVLKVVGRCGRLGLYLQMVGGRLQSVVGMWKESGWWELGY